MGSWTVPGYTEIRELDHGAAGRTMLAWHDPTGTPVAIRYLDHDPLTDDEAPRALRAEATRLSEVDSPHAIRYREYVESSDGSAVVMELVDGVSLREILDEGGPLTPMAAAVVLHDSLSGLAAAHERQVLHRRQRPEHVLVDTEGRAKLVEFAAAGACTYRPATVRTDLAAALDTYRESLAGSAAATDAPLPLPPPGEPGPSDAPVDAGEALALVARLTAAARDAYGPDWQTRGRDDLAARAARLLRMTAAPERPEPQPPNRRWDGRVLVGLAVALVVAATFASLVAR